MWPNMRKGTLLRKNSSESGLEVFLLLFFFNSAFLLK